jgi:hypothetical protein
VAEINFDLDITSIEEGVLWSVVRKFFGSEFTRARLTAATGVLRDHIVSNAQDFFDPLLSPAAEPELSLALDEHWASTESLCPLAFRIKE